jgi:ribulose-phosphate 3-epimerase
VGKLAASILSANHAHLADQVKLVEASADLIHVDVMDAHLVPPLTIGAVVVGCVRPHTDHVLHGHLAALSPEGLFEDLAEAGMDVVSFHVEGVDAPAPVIDKARGAGMRAGIAIHARTPVETVFPYLDDVDDVVIVNGVGSSSRTPDDEHRTAIEAARAEIERRGLSTDVHAEGGVTLANAGRFVDAGATVLVAGSAIFGARDVAAAAAELKAAAGGES